MFKMQISTTILCVLSTIGLMIYYYIIINILYVESICNFNGKWDSLEILVIVSDVVFFVWGIVISFVIIYVWSLSETIQGKNRKERNIIRKIYKLRAKETYLKNKKEHDNEISKLKCQIKCLEHELCKITDCLEKLTPTKTCMQCNSEYPKEAKFCPNCGCSIYNWDNPNPDMIKMINKTEEQKLCGKLIKEEQKLKKNELLNKIHTSTGTSYVWWSPDMKPEWYDHPAEAKPMEYEYKPTDPHLTFHSKKGICPSCKKLETCKKYKVDTPIAICDAYEKDNEQWICSYNDECPQYSEDLYKCNKYEEREQYCEHYKQFLRKYQNTLYTPSNPLVDPPSFTEKVCRTCRHFLKKGTYCKYCHKYSNYNPIKVDPPKKEKEKEGKCPYYDKCPNRGIIAYECNEGLYKKCIYYQKFEKEKERHACAECDLFNNNICEGFNIPAYGDTTGFCLKFKFRKKEKDKDLCEYYDQCTSTFKMDIEASWCWNEYIKSREKYCGTYKKFINKNRLTGDY